MNLREMWVRLWVRNWHRNIYMQNVPDCIMAHANRTAHLAWAIWPGDKDLFIACAMHDTGEGGPGDAPYDEKRDDPEFKAMMDRKEGDHFVAIGFTDIPDIHDPRVKLLDRVDRYMTHQAHRPDLMETPEWQQARRDIFDLSLTVDEGAKQQEILKLITEPVNGNY